MGFGFLLVLTVSGVFIANKYVELLITDDGTGGLATSHEALRYDDTK